MKKKQDKAICTDIEKLNKLIPLMPKEKQHIAKDLAGEIVFMADTLEKLKAQINEHGVVDWFEQGSNGYFRESPALKGYNTTIQRYSLIYKQFIDLLPKEVAKKEEGSQLLDFITKKAQ